MHDNHDGSTLAGQTDAATVMVFTKTPELGKVKTRLARSWGNTEALSCYEILVAQTLRSVSASGLPRQLHVAGSQQHPLWQQAKQQQWAIYAQQGRNLGERMFAACQGQRSILLGCDFPGLNAALLHSVNQLLRSNDVVAVPATDGGYVLLAMNNPPVELFTDMPWGGSEVWRKTLAAIHRLNLTVHVLPEAMDVDTADDWKRAEQAGLLPHRPLV